MRPHRRRADKMRHAVFWDLNKFSSGGVGRLAIPFDFGAGTMSPGGVTTMSSLSACRPHLSGINPGFDVTGNAKPIFFCLYRVIAESSQYPTLRIFGRQWDWAAGSVKRVDQGAPRNSEGSAHSRLAGSGIKRCQNSFQFFGFDHHRPAENP